MGVLQVSWLTRNVMYLAVRAFGSLAWYRNRVDRTVGFDRVRRDLDFKATARSRRPATLPQVAKYAFRRGRHESGDP
jgi:hypothetical protein